MNPPMQMQAIGGVFVDDDDVVAVVE